MYDKKNIYIYIFIKYTPKAIVVFCDVFGLKIA